mgnify:CR=1 FL=1
MRERLQHFPISFFSVILGLGGFTIALQQIESLIEIPAIASTWLVVGVNLLLVGLLLTYLSKLLIFPESVRAEFAHPIRLAFFPTISISLLLLSIAYLPLQETFADTFWKLGALLHLIFTLTIVSIWINREHFVITHLNPAWFIPAVGTLLVPVAGVPLGYYEVSWFFASIGLIFWIVLFTVFIYRIIFHDPLPERLYPTLAILIAPPAVGAISLIRLTEELGEPVRILYSFALFLTLLLALQIPRFFRLRFALSWWAYSFPVAAVTLATIMMHHATGLTSFRSLAIVLFSILSLLILVLIAKTIAAARRREICVPE